MKPTLIYCAGKNKRLEDIALEEGYKLGGRLPCYLYHPIYFADQDWKNPDRIKYMEAVKINKPEMATVIDWENEEQFEEVMDWADEISQYVNYVLIIPKVQNMVSRIPNKINNKDIVLAYSVPTQYGGTQLPYWQFMGRKIHFLGGSPSKQIEYYRYFRQIAEVISIDGNYHQMKATRFCEHWEYPNKWIPDGHKNKDAPYIAFQKSCHNIMEYWMKHD